MHEFMGLEGGADRYGRPAAIWICSCGRRGSGSRTAPEAQAGWIKHARGRARRERY